VEQRLLEKTSWADAVGAARTHGSAPGRPPNQAPRAAADEPQEHEDNPRRRRGEHKHHDHSDHSENHDHGNEEPGTKHGGPRNLVGPPTPAGQRHAAVAGDICEQRRKVAIGPGTQRSIYPQLKLIRLQPALPGRIAQSVDNRVAIGI
jgi:hypothetical protein